MMQHLCDQNIGVWMIGLCLSDVSGVDWKSFAHFACIIVCGCLHHHDLDDISLGGENRIAIDVSFRLMSTVHLPAP